MPGLEAGLAEQRRLLVAGDAADRDAGRHAGKPSPVTPNRPLDGTISGSARDRHVEQVAQLAIPLPTADVEQHRAAGVADGSVAYTAPPVRFQISQASIGAERQVRSDGHAALGRAATRSWCRRSTGRARARCARAPAGGAPAAVSSSQRCAVRRSCQTMAGAVGLAGASVPRHDRLALVGDADRGDVVGADRAVDLGDDLAQRRQHRLPDLDGVVLDPARLGEVLGELAVAAMLSRPSAKTARERTPVVPASRAITQASVTDGECTGHPPTGRGVWRQGAGVAAYDPTRARRNTDRRRRLPGSQRRHPGRRPQRRAGPRRRDDRIPRRVGRGP